MFFGEFLNSNESAQVKQVNYFAVALGLTTIALFCFFFVFYLPDYFLAVANSAATFSSVAIVCVLYSWNRPINPKLKYQFWFSFLVFTVFFQYLYLTQDFLVRVFVFNFFNIFLNIWMLYELRVLTKKQSSPQLWILKIAIVFAICFMVVRTYGLMIWSGSADTIYQENPLTTLIRLITIASTLLIFVAIRNILYERLWNKEHQKSEDIEQKMLASLNALALARDNETGNHIIRTQNYVKILAQRLKANGHYLEELTEPLIDALTKAAPLHDIGKVGIPDHILYKLSALSSEEWGVMKTHTNIGEFVLSSAKDQLENEDDHSLVIPLAIQIAKSHHEQWDGSGYPDGLKQAKIPLAARIMALADMYDALVSERVYKKSWAHEDAVQEIIEKSNTHFDPLVVEAFMDVADHFNEVAIQYLDGSTEKTKVLGSYLRNEQKLQRSEQRFQFLFDYSPIGMAMIDFVSGRFLEVNKSLLDYIGYTKDEFLSLTYVHLVPREFDEQENRQIETLKRTGFFGPTEKEYLRKDGTRLPISMRGFLLTDVDGRKLVWIIVEDVRGIKRTIEQQHSRNRVLERIVQGESESELFEQIATDFQQFHPDCFGAILLVDDNEMRLRVGGAVNAPEGFAELIQELPLMISLVCWGDVPIFAKDQKERNALNFGNAEVAQKLFAPLGFDSCYAHPIISPNGKVKGAFAAYFRRNSSRPNQDVINAIELSANMVSIVLERKTLEAKVHQMAFYDSLTKLPNRYLLMDRLAMDMASSKRTSRYGALLFIDLDSLKSLNDRYGHQVGDKLLVQAANRMLGCLRAIDTIARFGGDEFVIVLNELSTDKKAALFEINLIAQKIRAALEEPYLLETGSSGDVNEIFEHRSTASIGCKLFYGADESSDTLLKFADMAMYRAKKDGGNRIEFFDEIDFDNESD